MIGKIVKLIIVGTITVVTWGFLMENGLATPASLPVAFAAGVALWAFGLMRV